ncbi:hypothetical protein CR513_48794, partial [Mucuna pruriens]
MTHNRYKSYHDKRCNDLKFKEGDYVFLNFTPRIGVGRDLKSCKCSPCFIGPYQIMIIKRVGEVSYQVALPLILVNLHNIFHVSQVLLVRIKDCRIKQLRGKEIPLIKVRVKKEKSQSGCLRIRGNDPEECGHYLKVDILDKGGRVCHTFGYLFVCCEKKGVVTLMMRNSRESERANGDVLVRRRRE